jgi:very-short-patch-repair endonuclease/predicted transcriptional regulator of viral defense system
MDRKSAARARIESITELAERQHGVIATAQLYSLGLSQTQVATRARNGWLHRLHRGVYAVGHRRVSRHGLWMAAVLACGEGAVLSHGAAGELWKLSQSTEGATNGLDVTIPSQRGVLVRPGLVVHRVPSLRLEETTRHEGVPVTTPARTLLDLALELPRRELERAIDEAERLRLCRQADLEAIIEAHFGRAGAGALRRVLETHRIGTTLTRSELEERFLALCRRHRLPGPGVNVPLLDYVVDFLWPEARLIVEVDGRATHGTRRAFQADRDRDSRLAVAGYRVLRFTWWDVTRRPAVVADRVRRLLLAESRGAFPGVQ